MVVQARRARRRAKRRTEAAAACTAPAASRRWCSSSGPSAQRRRRRPAGGRPEQLIVLSERDVELGRLLRGGDCIDSQQVPTIQALQCTRDNHRQMLAHDRRTDCRRRADPPRSFGNRSHGLANERTLLAYLRTALMLMVPARRPNTSWAAARLSSSPVGRSSASDVVVAAFGSLAIRGDEAEDRPATNADRLRRSERQLMPAALERQLDRLRVDRADRIGRQLVAQIFAGVQRFEVQRVGNDDPALFAVAAGDALEKLFVIAKSRREF